MKLKIEMATLSLEQIESLAVFLRTKKIAFSQEPVLLQADVSGSSLVDKVNSVEFYDLMQSYRHAPMENQSLVIEKYGDVQKWIVENCR